MADYTITFARSAEKELGALNAKLVSRIFSKIEKLSTEPRPSTCVKLTGENNLWRTRIKDYRVIYKIDDRQKSVDTISVRHRRDVYR